MSNLTTVERFMAGLSGFLLGAAVLGFAAAPVSAQDEPVHKGMANQTIAADPGGVVAGQYIVVLNDDVTNVRGAASEMGRTHGLGLRFIYTSALKGFAARVPEGRLAALERDPRIAYIEQDRLGGIELNPVAGVQRIFADLVKNSDGAYIIDGADDLRVDVDVAVIDAGIQIDHPDLNVAGSINCTAGNRFNPVCEDGTGGAMHWHGTHVAGTIAALDNGTDVLYYDVPTDVVGVAPGARLWAVRVVDKRGSGTVSQYIAGVDWVAANAATIEVANSSLGYPSSDAICQAVAALAAAGVTHTVSAGNEGTEVFKSPGNCGASVITVSAMADYDGIPGELGEPTCSADPDDTLASFSNYGDLVDITAPGVCVVSTYLDSWYAVSSGSSMSAPHAAGAAALLAASGETVPANIKSKLLASGNFDWNDNAPDLVHEPLLDVGHSTDFTPATVAVGSGSDPVNAAPNANFNISCSGWNCQFTDASTDSDGDGTIMSWAWDFGDSYTSTDQNPIQDYSANDTYTVTLTVTDDEGATGNTSRNVTVSDAAGDITLAAALQGKVNKRTGLQKIKLEWSGATTANVDVKRDGVTIATTANDGSYTDSVLPAGSYDYEICEAGTANCSNVVNVSF